MALFEFDQVKSLTNKEKHGMDFNEAQRLWDDPGIIEMSAATTNEPRSLTIGCIDGKHWTAITTIRSDKIRIISVRRSRKNEEEIYEEYNGRRI